VPSSAGSIGVSRRGQTIDRDSKTGYATTRVSDKGIGGMRDVENARGDGSTERLEPLSRDNGRARNLGQDKGRLADERNSERRI